MERKKITMFEFKIEKKSNVIWVNLLGKLVNPDDASQLENSVAENLTDSSNSLILNLKELEYINSSGLNSLIKLFTRSRNLGGDATICNMNQSVKNLVLVTKLNTVFTITDSINNIDEYLNNK
jgi:anti-sigma B factor antagonist